MEKKYTYPLFDTVFNRDFPECQYYVIEFDTIPSIYDTKNQYHHSVIQYLIQEKGYKVAWKSESEREAYHSSNEMVLINWNKRILLKIDLSTVKKYETVKIQFLYDLSYIKNSIKNVIDELNISTFIREKKRSNINLVKSDMGSLDTEEYDIPIPSIDIELNYGHDFVKIHELIIKRLNKDKDKGIILLHGDSGTGKTSYLKYLTKFIENKDVLFIPPSMAEMLSEPSIIPFLMEKRNSILIIEDAERVIGDRQGGGSSSAGVSNILNLTDGILGECLNIQVIATFNTQRENIDKALLRKGRLIAEHKFDKLSVENTNKLLKHLNKDFISDEPLALAEIYNIDVDDARITKETPRIGFKI